MMAKYVDVIARLVAASAAGASLSIAVAPPAVAGSTPGRVQPSKPNDIAGRLASIRAAVSLSAGAQRPVTVANSFSRSGHEAPAELANSFSRSGHEAPVELANSFSRSGHDAPIELATLSQSGHEAATDGQ